MHTRRGSRQENAARRITFINKKNNYRNYSAPPQNIGYAVKLAIKSWQV